MVQMRTYIQNKKHHDNYRQRLREETFREYGDGSCKACGSQEHLTLDHIHGEGDTHRRSLFPKYKRTQGGWMFYAKLKAAGFPDKDKIQVLCNTCNVRRPRKTEKPFTRQDGPPLPQGHPDLPSEEAF